MSACCVRQRSGHLDDSSGGNRSGRTGDGGNNRGKDWSSGSSNRNSSNRNRNSRSLVPNQALLNTESETKSSSSDQKQNSPLVLQLPTAIAGCLARFVSAPGKLYGMCCLFGYIPVSVVMSLPPS